MRIKSAHVRNYRILRDATVRFADGITLVSGPNESGKSTLVEAIRAALFVKAKGTGEFQRLGDPAGASVDLEIETGLGTATLSKRFQNGASLTLPGRPTIQDSDEAEAALGRLLKTGDAPLSGRTANARAALSGVWGHLFVAQGSAGTQPLGDPNIDGKLRVSLSAAPGSIAFSAEDNRVAAEVQNRFSFLFTKNGYKTGSAAKTAEDALAEAKRKRGECLTALGNREEVARRIGETTQKLDHLRVSIATARKELGEKRSDLDTIENKRAKLKKLGETAETQAKEASELETLKEEVEELQKEIKKLEREKTTVDNHVRISGEALSSAKSDLEEAKAAHTKAESLVESLRNQERILRLQTDEWNERNEADRKIAEWNAVDELERASSKAAEDRDRIAAVSDNDVNVARNIKSELDSARAALEALGVRIRPEEGGEPVRAGESGLPAGKETIFTDDFDLVVGKTIVHVRLGGDKGLAESRGALKAAEDALKARLGAFGCATMEELGHLRVRRAAAEATADSKANELKKRLGGKETSVVKLEADTAEAAAKAAKSNLANEQLEPLADETAEAEAKRRIGDLSEKIGQATKEAGEKRTSAEECEQLVKTAERTLDEDMDNAAEIKQKLGIRSALLKSKLADYHGDANELARVAKNARAAADDAAAAMEPLQDEIDGLAPDAVSAEAENLEKKIVGLEDELDRKNVDLNQAIGEMKSDGRGDPNANLRDAEAEVSRAQDAFEVQKRLADAVRLLHETVEDERRAVGAALAAPLRDKAQPYLETLFGPRVRTAVTGLSGLVGETPAIVLERDDGNFGLADLSGGAAEQVATAMRLAMAEVLAEEHDGCLPVVLDDAFANSDPARVVNIQRMLRLARNHGLQIILLTCEPDRYLALGEDATVALEHGAVV